MKIFVLFAMVTGSLIASPTAPALRLTHDVEPRNISLDLTLVPARDSFSGRVDIDLNVRTEVDHFWLNATGLQIADATLEQSGRSLNAKVIAGGEDFVGFQFPSTLQTGSAKFTVTYTGKVSLKSSEGLFRNERNGDTYLFTQFEPIDARRAFPSFDEPGFKVPWNLTLHVPEKDSAVANTSIEREVKEASGMKAVSFRQTKPLPSYLVAFAVGPFEFVDAGTAGQHHVPVRIVVPRGDRDRAKYAASVSAEILNRLEQYFNIPYPYDKSDQLAVPLSFGGAMENPGLVTYDADIILSPAAQDTINRQRLYASIAAHELAHQWFGDMVTMTWWNDVWLNESFATWMSSRLIADWKPEWETRAEDQGSRLMAARVDTKVSARRINQPAENKGDIGNAFDGITYQKGGSVLAMFENAIGPERFRTAVHKYLAAHLFGNATADDFLAALGAESKPEYASAFATFLNQNGIPQVSANLKCSEGSSPKIKLEQQRLLPLGSAGDARATWNIPICVAYSFGQGRQQKCQLLTGKMAEVELSGSGCPAWYLANAKEVGYFEAIYPESALLKLLDHRNELSLAEQVGVLGDIHLLAETGKLPIADGMRLVPQLANDPNYQIVEAAIKLASPRSIFIPSELRPAYADFVQRNFGSRARSIGWIPKPGESDNDRLLRDHLPSFVAENSHDPELVSEATRLSKSWLADHKAVSPDLVRSILRVAAQHGDQQFFDQLVEAAKTETDPSFRPVLIQSLGQFRDPKLVERSTELAFDGTFDARMSMRLVLAERGDPSLSQIAYTYVRTHYDQIVSNLPTGIGTSYAAMLPSLASANGCSEKSLAEAKAFFGPRMEKVQGGPRTLANALESIRLCAAEKDQAQASVRKFFTQPVGSRAATK